MTNTKQGRNRFTKYAITKDIAAKIKDELKSLEASGPAPDPPKETYTLGDFMRENFSILESLKNKKYKTEVIAGIFRQFGIDATAASIKAYNARIRKDLRENKLQGKQEVKKKVKTHITQEKTTLATQKESGTKLEVLKARSTLNETTGVWESKIESNNPIQVGSVNIQNEKTTTKKNESLTPNVNTDIVNHVNDVDNVIVIERLHDSDIKPVPPIQMVQEKRKDDF